MDTQHHTQEANARHLITREAAAKRYSVHVNYLDRLIAEGVIPTVKLGRRCVRIPVTLADSALEQLATGGVK